MPSDAERDWWAKTLTDANAERDRLRLAHAALLAECDTLEATAKDTRVRAHVVAQCIRALLGSATPTPQPVADKIDYAIARQLDSAAGCVSGLGEYGLANRLWALAGHVRKRRSAPTEATPVEEDR